MRRNVPHEEEQQYMKYLYLHGLGQKPDSWNSVIKETKVSESSVKLSLAEMLEGKSATYKELYSAFSSEYVVSSYAEFGIR